MLTFMPTILTDLLILEKEREGWEGILRYVSQPDYASTGRLLFFFYIAVFCSLGSTQIDTLDEQVSTGIVLG